MNGEEQRWAEISCATSYKGLFMCIAYWVILRRPQLCLINVGSSDMLLLVDVSKNLSFSGRERSTWHSCIHSYVLTDHNIFRRHQSIATVFCIPFELQTIQKSSWNERWGTSLCWNYSCAAYRWVAVAQSRLLWLLKHWASGALCISCAAGAVQKSREAQYKAAASMTSCLMAGVLLNLCAYEALLGPLKVALL